MNQTSQQNEGVLLWGQRWLHREPPPWQSLGTQKLILYNSHKKTHAFTKVADFVSRKLLTSDHGMV